MDNSRKKDPDRQLESLLRFIITDEDLDKLTELAKARLLASEPCNECKTSGAPGK